MIRYFCLKCNIEQNYLFIAILKGFIYNIIYENNALYPYMTDKFSVSVTGTAAGRNLIWQIREKKPVL